MASAAASRTSTATPRDGLLLLGMHSWPNAESLRRRRVIRTIAGHVARSDVLRLVFIMQEGGFKRNTPRELAGEDADVIHFPMGIHGKSVHKYLLANAFLRYATTTTFAFVGRSEDDALFDAAPLVAALQHLEHHPLPPPSEPKMVLYGVRGQWVMWDDLGMLPMCWSYTANAAVRSALRCKQRYLGPFPLWEGPLVIYSMPLARALVDLPAFTTNEARVASNRSDVVRGVRQD